MFLQKSFAMIIMMYTYMRIESSYSFKNIQLYICIESETDYKLYIYTINNNYNLQSFRAGSTSAK